MTLLEKQQSFMLALGAFLETVYGDRSLDDVDFTGGDLWAHDGHMDGSLHYIRLAVDLNLFYRGKYIRTYEEAPHIWDRLGEIWKSTHHLARWGGDFESRDLNHYSFEHDGVQ